VLAARLGLPPDALASHHRLGRPSGDHVRLTRGPPRRAPGRPEIQTPGHTDFGTVTVLFNWLGGLQVWSVPSRGETGFANVVDPTAAAGGGGGGGGGAVEAAHDGWLWVVPPPPGCAVVNLGDAAVKLSGGVLCSGRHRVVPAPGEQGLLPRYSVVYFVRPNDDIILRRLKAPGIPDGGKKDEDGITAKEWIIRQSAALGNTIQRS